MTFSKSSEINSRPSIPFLNEVRLLVTIYSKWLYLSDSCFKTTVKGSYATYNSFIISSVSIGSGNYSKSFGIISYTFSSVVLAFSPTKFLGYKDKMEFNNA